MMVQQIKANKYGWGVALLMLLLVVAKLPFLTLPYYYDEAWPYGVAIRTLHHHGLSLLPTAMDPFLSRGHPLMFHFLGAAWMKIFGTSLLSGHSFAMAVSLTTLLLVYIFCKRVFTARAGFVAVLLLVSQAIFIFQSAFLLPEMLMAMWTMACFYFFFSGMRVAYVLAAAAMLVTKESGGMLIMSLAFCELVYFFGEPERTIKKFISRQFLVCIPVVIAFTYYLIQRIAYGWFLYPFYMDYLRDSWKAFAENLPSGAAYIFIYDGRNGLSFFLLASLVVVWLNKKLVFQSRQRQILWYLFVFVLFYLLFSTVNYYIPRYLLCVFPPFVIVASVLIDKAFSGIKYVYPLIVAGLLATQLFFYINARHDGDGDYSPSIKVAMKMVQYCEQQQMQDKHIYTTCVLRYDFTEPYVGFLSAAAFRHIEWQPTAQTEYCIFSSDENEAANFEQLKQERGLILVKRYELGAAWIELHKVTK